MRDLFKNAGILLTGSVFSNVLNLGSSILVTRSLGASVFGYYAILLVVVVVTERLCTLQSWQTFVAFVGRTNIRDERAKSLIKFLFFFDVLVYLLGFSLLFFTGKYLLLVFSIPAGYLGVLRILAVSLLVNPLTITTGILRVYEDYKTLSYTVLLQALLKFSLVLIFFLSGLSVVNFALAHTTAIFISSLLPVYSIIKLHGLNRSYLSGVISSRININEFRKDGIITFIRYNYLDSSVRMVSRNFDVLALGHFVANSSFVAFYKISKDISSIFLQVSDPLYQVLFPEFSKIKHEGNRKEHIKLKRNSVRISVIIALVFYLIYVLLGHNLIYYTYGEEFLYSYKLGLIYIIAVSIAVATMPFAPAILAAGMPKKLFRINIIVTCVYLIFLAPLIIFYKTQGAALAYVIYNILWAILALQKFKKL